MSQRALRCAPLEEVPSDGGGLHSQARLQLVAKCTMLVAQLSQGPLEGGQMLVMGAHHCLALCLLMSELMLL